MKANRGIIVVALVVAICAMTTALVQAEEKNDGSTLTKVGDPAPDFELTTLDGQKITNESVKGKVVLLNFFATWCGPCRTELPHLSKTYQEWKDDDRVIVLSVGREHTKDDLTKFKEETKLDLSFAPDPEREMYSKFATRWIPRNYVIAPDGTIAMQEIGFDEDAFKAMIALIEELRSGIEESPEA